MTAARHEESKADATGLDGGNPPELKSKKSKDTVFSTLHGELWCNDVE